MNARPLAPKMNARPLANQSVTALSALFPELKRELPTIAYKQPFELGVSFLDLSNLCGPGERRASMTLTMTGPRLPFLIQGVYTCEQVSGEAATMRVSVHVELGGYKTKVELAAAPHARPVVASPSVSSLQLPTALEPLRPVLHVMARAPYNLLPSILTGELHATLWKWSPGMLNGPPRASK